MDFVERITACLFRQRREFFGSWDEDTGSDFAGDDAAAVAAAPPHDLTNPEAPDSTTPVSTSRVVLTPRRCHANV
jgi:hypothetical protein